MGTALPIERWPGFFITRDGRVLGPKGEKAQSILKKSGHRYVSFWRDGKAHKEYVHRLVAEHFIGEIPKGMHVCHGPEGVSVNGVDNLRIDTPKGNAADTLRDGTRAMGSRNGHAKLTEEQVAYIRSRRGEYRGVQRHLAAELGVTESVISQIMNHRAWLHGIETKGARH